MKEKVTGWQKKWDIGLEDLVAMIFSKKTGLEVFPVRKIVPASLLSVHACRCRLFYPVSRMEVSESWNVKPVITMPKINGQMTESQKTMFFR